MTKLCSNKNLNNGCQIEVSAHDGFMKITTTHLIPEILKALKTSKSKVTYVTGHSLGGAMATITSGFASRNTLLSIRKILLIFYNFTKRKLIQSLFEGWIESWWYYCDSDIWWSTSWKETIQRNLWQNDTYIQFSFQKSRRWSGFWSQEQGKL